MTVGGAVPSPPASLLIVVTEDWYFLSHRLQLAKDAARRGLRVTIATGPGERSADIRQAGFEHLVFPLNRRSLNVWREMQTLRALTTLMRTLRPSLVHLVAAKPIMYGNIAAGVAGRPPTLSAIAGLGYLYLGGGIGRRVLRAAYELTFRTLIRQRPEARVLVQNPDDGKFLLERGMVKASQLVCITGSGVDVQRFAPSPEPASLPIVILMHSRMLWDKGVAELVEATRQLRARNVPKFVVRLAGDPDLHNPAAISLRQLQDWSNEGVVEWISRAHDIPGELQRCHIACLPSYREGAPLSLLEAAACGRPIVTTDVPGCREVVHHEQNGLLVPVRDARALADALERLILDGGLRRRFGVCGRERAEREFSSDVVNDKIISTYFQMMAAARTHA